MKSASLSGFAIWFDVEFIGTIISVFPISTEYGNPSRQSSANLNGAPIMSTRPEDPPTHWKQTLVYCSDPIEVEKEL